MVFRYISQLRNETDRRLGFELSIDRYCPVPDLPPGKTRQVSLSRILRYLGEYKPYWKIRVLMDDQFTGIELDPMILLYCTRILFTYGNGSDRDVLFVKGVPEKSIDYWLRLKYFGSKRNKFWDARKSFPIHRSDLRLAMKSRNVEARDQNLASLPDTTLPESSSTTHTQSPSPPIRKIKKGDNPAAPPQKPRTLPAPPPPSQTRSREQYYSAAEDSSDEEYSWWDATDHDSSSDTISSGRRREENSPVPMEISDSDGGVRGSVRREQKMVSHRDPEMDRFERVFLFCFALALVWFIPKLFF